MQLHQYIHPRTRARIHAHTDWIPRYGISFLTNSLSHTHITTHAHDPPTRRRPRCKGEKNHRRKEKSYPNPSTQVRSSELHAAPATSSDAMGIPNCHIHFVLHPSHPHTLTPPLPPYPPARGGDQQPPHPRPSRAAAAAVISCGSHIGSCPCFVFGRRAISVRVTGPCKPRTRRRGVRGRGGHDGCSPAFSGRGGWRGFVVGGWVVPDSRG